jgi:Tfp pilus assembly protein PilF
LEVLNWDSQRADLSKTRKIAKLEASAGELSRRKRKSSNVPAGSVVIAPENQRGADDSGYLIKACSVDEGKLGGKANVKRSNAIDKAVHKPLKKEKKRKDAPQGRDRRRDTNRKDSSDDEREEVSSSAPWTVSRVLGLLSHWEQEFGSSIFMMAYFGIYFYLHGFSYRLVFIGAILIMQFYYQSTWPWTLRVLGARVCGLVSRSGSGMPANHALSVGRERRPVRLRLEKKYRRLQSTFWVISFSCVVLTSNFLYERYAVPRPPQVALPGFRIEALRGSVNFSLQVKAPLPKASESDRLCEEAQIAEAVRAWPDVESKLIAAINLDPSHVCSLYNYGRLLDYVWHNSAKAEEMYQRALAANPTHMPSLRNYGYFQYYVRKNFSKAEKMWQVAISVQPSDIDVLSGYGLLKYQIHGDWTEGERLFRQATHFNPAHVPSLLHLAALLRFAVKNEVEAEKMYRAVLQQMPNHVGAMMDYAAMMYDSAEQARGHVKRSINKAAELWGQAIRLHPNHMDALFLLGRSARVLLL